MKRFMRQGFLWNAGKAFEAGKMKMNDRNYQNDNFVNGIWRMAGV